jgi:hypothetical protein
MRGLRLRFSPPRRPVLVPGGPISQRRHRLRLRPSVAEALQDLAMLVVAAVAAIVTVCVAALHTATPPGRRGVQVHGPRAA